jgi:hypothetical protein
VPPLTLTPRVFPPWRQRLPTIVGRAAKLAVWRKNAVSPGFWTGCEICRWSPGYGCSTGWLVHIPRPKLIGFGSGARNGCGEHSPIPMLMGPGRARIDAHMPAMLGADRVMMLTAASMMLAGSAASNWSDLRANRVSSENANCRNWRSIERRRRTVSGAICDGAGAKLPGSPSPHVQRRYHGKSVFA